MIIFIFLVLVAAVFPNLLNFIMTEVFVVKTLFWDDYENGAYASKTVAQYAPNCKSFPTMPDELHQVFCSQTCNE